MFQVQHLMRKYQKYILVSVIVLIIGPFVIWGGYAGRSSGPQQGEKEAGEPVAVVGGIPISLRAFRNQLDRVVKSRYPAEAIPDYRALQADGTVDMVLTSLVNSALIELETDGHLLDVDRDYLVEKLKQDPFFRDESGQFDARRWNAFVDSMQEQNWNEQYESLKRQVSRQAFGELVSASARVLDDEVRRRFEEMNTRISVKYAAIKPDVTPTEEQIQAQYDESPELYELPEQRKAAFAAISLEPPMPPLAGELVQRARAGEDFAELARTYSEGPHKAEGGDLGWIQQTFTIPNHQAVLFDLDVGEVSEPVGGPLGYYIYKVEDERVSELVGQRDIRARQIVLRPELSEDERANREKRAELLAARAEESGNLQEAAEDAGIEVKTSGMFSRRSNAVANVPAEDAPAFIRGLSDLEQGAVSDVVKGRKNLYVAQIVEVEPPVPQPLEAVRDRVVEDAIRKIRRTPEYEADVERYIEQIAGRASSLADIQHEFPELPLEIKETKPFSIRAMGAAGVYWNNREVFEILGDGEPGAFGGPVTDFMGTPYFVELIERIPPSETDWEEKWPQEKERLRQMLIAERRRKRFEDYVMHLRDRAQVEVGVQVNYDVVARALGLDEPEPSLPEPPQDSDTAEEAGAEAAAEAGSAVSDALGSTADSAGADDETAPGVDELPASESGTEP